VKRKLKGAAEILKASGPNDSRALLGNGLQEERKQTVGPPVPGTKGEEKERLNSRKRASGKVCFWDSFELSRCESGGKEGGRHQNMMAKD